MSVEYVRFSEGLSNYKLIPKEEVYNHVTNENKDYYVSVFYYNEDHYKRFKETGSISGIKDVVTDQLIFDFDHKEDLNKAKEDASLLVNRLLNNRFHESSLEIAFSGNKGFHVTVFLQDKLSPQEIKSVASYFAEDLPTFDKVVYDPNRIIRLTYTKNQKSGLYKVPISKKELESLSVEEIKKKAKSIAWCKEVEYSPSKLPEDLLKKAQANTIAQDLSNEQKIYDTLDLTKKPKWLTPARFALQEGFFVEGERNSALMILAATYKYQGFDKLIAYRMLKGVAELQALRTNSERFPEKEIWNNIINTVYSDDWRGGVFAEDHPLLVAVTKRLNLPTQKELNDPTTVYKIENVFASFKEFAQNIDKNTIELGIPEIDSEVRLTTSMVIGLLAAPSGGKTSIALNIINSASKKGVKSMFFSMDTAAPLLFQRLIQKHTQMTSDDIFAVYKSQHEEKIEKIESTLSSNYENVLFSFSTSLTVDDIRQSIIDTQQKIGDRIKLVCIDYLECIQSPYSDPTASSAYNVQKLKDIANDLDVAILLLLQPQKQAGDPSEELLSMRNIKGASAIEQACSVVFTMWRPGFNPQERENDRFLSIAVVKNRMGPLGSWDFRWNGLTGKIENLDSYDSEVLKEIREQKAREKEEL